MTPSTQAEPEKKYQTFISVFELPSMAMLTDSDGNKTSIQAEGIKEFRMAPHKNMLIYTSFPE
jgi:hypothetical protein